MELLRTSNCLAPISDTTALVSDYAKEYISADFRNWYRNKSKSQSNLLLILQWKMEILGNSIVELAYWLYVCYVKRRMKMRFRHVPWGNFLCEQQVTTFHNWKDLILDQARILEFLERGDWNFCQPFSRPTKLIFGGLPITIKALFEKNQKGFLGTF